MCVFGKGTIIAIPLKVWSYVHLTSSCFIRGIHTTSISVEPVAKCTSVLNYLDHENANDCHHF